MPLEWVNLIKQALRRIFYLGESQRLKWASKSINYFLPSCSLTSSQLSDLILSWKGIVLDSIMEDMMFYKSVNKSNNDQIKSLHVLKAEQAALAIRNNFDSVSKIEAIQQKIDLIESSFGQKNSNKPRSSELVKFSQIQHQIDTGMVVLEMVVFVNPINKNIQIGVSVITKSGDPQWLNINDSNQIIDSLKSYRKAIASGDDGLLKTHIQLISDKLWKPIAASLPQDTKKIYIGADGPLNFLSFATLLDDQGKFLSERYQIAYVGSARDLLRLAKPSSAKNLVIYANPIFSSVSTNGAPSSKTNDALLGMRAIELAEFAKVQLPQLPGSEREAAIVSQIAMDAQWTNETHLGLDASKKGLMTMTAPAVLHLATHGFFLGGEEIGGDGERGMKIAAVTDATTPAPSANPKPLKISPMRQSGVALTGGQSTLQAWGRGEFPDPSNDGILTAEEVAGLDLDGNWLVTLSACETGVGQVQSGEGVFGLRRAFMMAGAQNLLMTLWPVSDDVTPKIMADFYKKALATHDAAGALSDVQRDWLVKLRDEKGLLAAVRDAGPFAMVVMANPNAKEAPDIAVSHSAAGGGKNEPNNSSAEEISATSSTKPYSSASLELPPPISSSVNATASSTAPGADSAAQSGLSQGQSGKVLSFEEASRRADAGDAYAQAVVSVYYKVGYKVPIDFSLSAKYAMKSAAQNNPLGIYQLGGLRTQGKGMEKNPQQGLALQKKALEGIKAMPEDPYAMTFLGQFEAKTNPAGAFKLYQRAAGMGYPVAVGLLSSCYHHGNGTAKNPEMAAKTLKMAADMGLGLAKQAEALIESAGR